MVEEMIVTHLRVEHLNARTRLACIKDVENVTQRTSCFGCTQASALNGPPFLSARGGQSGWRPSNEDWEPMRNNGCPTGAATKASYQRSVGEDAAPGGDDWHVVCV